MKRCLAGALLLLCLPLGARASPIRANTSGTGVYQGNELVTGVLADEGSGESGTERHLTSFVELRYIPTTHWVVGVRVPYAVQNRLEAPGSRSESVSGWGDVVLTAKHRVYRAVGPWWDRHAAIQVGVKLPTGSTRSLADPLVPLATRSRFQPGTGSTDFLLDAVYQQAHGRWGSAADLGLRYNTEGSGGLQVGNEIRLNGSVQYVLLPRVYTQPGHELFVLLEGTALRKEDDRLRGDPLAGTHRTELLLAPGLQYVATEQLFLDLSVQFPLAADLGRHEPRGRWNGLVQVRYAF
jgi:hypothetical protein